MFGRKCLIAPGLRFSSAIEGLTRVFCPFFANKSLPGCKTFGMNGLQPEIEDFERLNGGRMCCVDLPAEGR
jgi:hypothetical protein